MANTKQTPPPATGPKKVAYSTSLGDFIANVIPGNESDAIKQGLANERMVFGPPREMMPYPHAPNPLKAKELEVKGYVGVYFKAIRK